MSQEAQANRVLGLATIQCLVGRNLLRDRYWILDRSYGAEGMDYSKDGFGSVTDFLRALRVDAGDVHTFN